MGLPDWDSRSINDVDCEPALNIDHELRASRVPKQQVAAPVGVQSTCRFTQ
jgi:hypothetical protein